MSPSYPTIDAVLTIAPRAPSSIRFGLRDRRRRQPHHVEHRGQVELDRLLEAVEVERGAVLADQPAAAGRTAVGVDRNAQRASDAASAIAALTDSSEVASVGT